MNALLLLPAAYLVGSVNVAVIVLRLGGKRDPRLQFSGNAGTTNVYRQHGWLWAAGVLLLDMARAAVLALLAEWLVVPALVPWVGFFLIVGNRWPVFHGFRGGKGVGNFLGFTLFLHPLVSVAGMAAWVAAYALLRQPFLGSFAMVAVLGAGSCAAWAWEWTTCLGTGATVAVIFAAHLGNIRTCFRLSQ